MSKRQIILNNNKKPMTPYQIFVFYAFLLPAKLTHASFTPTEIEKEETVKFNGSVLFEREAKSAVHCALMCVNTPPCESVTMIASASGSSLNCQGQTVWFSMNATLETDGTLSTTVWSVRRDGWLEKACTNNTECTEDNAECFAGHCVCSPGYYYSHSNNSCVEGCLAENLQPRFLLYPGMKIKGNNFARLINITLSDCLINCTQSSELRTCDYKSWETKDGSVCSLQTITKLDITDQWVFAPLNNHYQRTCL